MNEKMYAKMLDVCCWVARRKFQVGGSLAANYILNNGLKENNAANTIFDEQL